MDLVNEYIRKNEAHFPRYEYLENLYEGFHDIFNLPEKENWKPDNRLAVNLPKYVTDVFLGYCFGAPITKTHDDKATSEAISNFDKLNRISEHDFEMAKKVCKYGHAFEYMYQDEEAKTRVSDHTPKELFVVYENTLRKAGYFAVRYGVKDDLYTKYGEVITPEEIIEFEGDEFKDRRPNPYGKICVVEWLMNEERMSLYEEITAMTEAINKTLAEKVNDVDAFAEAYLAVIGAELDEEGVARIRDNRLINICGTDNARDVVIQFLQKPSADGTQENLLDRLERLVHKISKVPDINSESFGSASGNALSYRLHSMSDLANLFFEKVKKSQSKRYKLFCTLAENTPNKDVFKDIKFTMSKNTPKNRLEEVQTAQAAEGMISHETQLELLSFVDDPQTEIKRIEKEEKANQKKLEDLGYNFGAVNEDNSTTEETEKESKS